MKPTVVIVLGVLVASSTGPMAGCDDDSTAIGGSGGVDDAGGSSLDGGLGQGGSPEPEKPDCYDEAAAVVISDGTFDGITLGQGLCEPQQVTDLYAACIGATSTVEACDAFKEAAPANETCVNCLLPLGAAPSPLSVILPSDSFQYLTLFGCQAQAMGLPECAVPIESLLFCGRTACETCADDDANTDCVNYAINPPGICGEVALPDGCEAVFSATALDPECIGDATDFETAFTVLATLYCGAP